MGLPALNKKKLVCFGVGSKKIKTLKGREITRVLLRYSKRISTRDEAFKEILSVVIRSTEKKLKQQPLTITGDSALFVDTKTRSTHDGNTVLFCPRRLTVDNRTLYHESLDKSSINRVRHMQAKAADALIGQGYEVKFVPFHTVQPDDDREEIRVIRNLMTEKDMEVLDRPCSPLDGGRLISGATLMVGLRLHSLVLAASCGVPFTTINYDIKMGGFMTHMGLKELCCSPKGGIEKLVEASSLAVANKEYSDKIIGRVREIRGKIREEAIETARIIQGLNEGQDKPGHHQRGTRIRLPEP